jgi:hypothetical protein
MFRPSSGNSAKPMLPPVRERFHQLLANRFKFLAHLHRFNQQHKLVAAQTCHGVGGTH